MTPYLLIVLCFGVMTAMYLLERRDAKRRAAKYRADMAGWVRVMRDAGFTGLQRFAAMQANGVTREEIAQAERDAK